MKRSIKTYLDYSGELYENIVPLSSAMSDEKVTESDREKLQKLIDLAQQNDANFHHFISNNTIPADYKQPSKEIHDYISSSTALSVELEQELDKLAEDGNLFKTDFSFTKRFEKVNGRKQKEIEKFLKEKKIETEYFKNNKKTPLYRSVFSHYACCCALYNSSSGFMIILLTSPITTFRRCSVSINFVILASC